VANLARGGADVSIHLPLAREPAAASP
jgi:hypothetical protein